MPRPTHQPPRPAKTPLKALSAARRAADAMRAAATPSPPGASSAAPQLAPPTSPVIDPTIADPVESADVVAGAIERRTKQQDDRDPFALILSAAREAGFGDAFARALATRLSRNPEFFATGEKLSNEQLIAALDDKIRLFLAHVDPVVVAEMKGRDLMIAMGIALDKKRLLQGEPTEIVDTRLRKSLDELLPLVVEEARRRGIDLAREPMIDVTPGRGGG